MAAVHLLASSCSPEAQPAQRSEKSEPTALAGEPQGVGKLVLAFGDSLYAGYGLAPNESFPAQLEQALRKSGVAVSVQNAGVSGDTTAAGLERLEFTLAGLPRVPDLAIVGLGGNDMLRGLDPAVTRRNLQSICGRLRERGIPVVLTGMLAPPNLGADYRRRFDAVFPDVAKQCGAALYPFFLQGVVTDSALMLPDRIHPNREGVQRVVRAIAPTIGAELAKAPSRQ
ncbi:arylesterase [Sphingomonas piscis]|uniref:arylesterase n=1 Tax=Sphingomonas piscis TaxID=2714943 RepID=UPI003CCDA81D